MMIIINDRYHLNHILRFNILLSVSFLLFFFLYTGFSFFFSFLSTKKWPGNFSFSLFLMMITIQRNYFPLFINKYNNFFFFLSSFFFTAWIYHHLFIHFPMKGYLSCFQFLVIMNILLQTFECWFLCEHKFSNHLSKYPGMQLLDHMASL